MRTLGHLKALAKRGLPTPVWATLRALTGRHPAPAACPASRPSPLALYETPWEKMGTLYSDDEVVGSGDFDLIGRIELGILLGEGLRPTDTLVDFGCGTGRLAVHVIPRLAGGHYVGIDISQSMLDKARRRIDRLTPDPPCRVTWPDSPAPGSRSTTPVWIGSAPSPSSPTLEHEDSYRYLVDARRVVRPGGLVVFSCLPMTLKLAQQSFLASARHDVQERWNATRDITTSVDVMTAVVRLAGWEPVRWYDGDEPNIALPDTGELHALGQSTCVLRAASPDSPAGLSGQAS